MNIILFFINITEMFSFEKIYFNVFLRHQSACVWLYIWGQYMNKWISFGDLWLWTMRLQNGKKWKTISATKNVWQTRVATRMVKENNLVEKGNNDIISGVIVVP